jgi:hypothetical protein
LALLVATLLACSGAPDTREPVTTNVGATSALVTVSIPTTTVTTLLGAPLTGAPRLVI